MNGHPVARYFRMFPNSDTVLASLEFLRGSTGMRVAKLRVRIVMVALLIVVARASASRLCVKVTDEAELPIPETLIRIIELKTTHSHEQHTNEDGRTCFTEIAEGAYSVEASRQGFLNAKYFPLHVAPVQTATLTIRLPIDQVVEGRVTEDVIVSGTLTQRDAPFSNVNICFRSMKDRRRSCVTSDRIGQYFITLRPGVFEIELRSDSKVLRKLRVDLTTPGGVYHDILKLPRLESK